MLKFFTKLRESLRSDKADLVQTVIIIAGFAVAAIISVGVVSMSLQEKGEWTANCINNASAFQNEGELSRENCTRGTGDSNPEKEACEATVIVPGSEFVNEQYATWVETEDGGFCNTLVPG